MPTINVGFLRKMHKELSFDTLTWRTIETLLHQNRPFADCLRLVRNANNAWKVDCILGMLDKGDSIEMIVKALHKDPVGKQLHFYVSFIPFSEAVTTSLDMVIFEKSMKKKLTSVLLYPCFLILFSTLVLFLFSYLILPTLVSMLEMNDFSLLAIVSFMNRVLVLFYVCISLFLILYLYFYCRGQLIQLWKLLHIVHLDNLLQKYVTFLFSQYLYVLMSHGVSTKRSMEVLKEFSDKPLIQFMALSLHEQLLAGDSFDKVIHNEYLDDTFCMICHLGYQTNSFIQALEEYKDVVKMWLDSSIKRLSVLVQFVAYGFIGVLVVVVYQIMLLPLSLFEMM